jgi:hypothetical protein
VSIVDHEVWPFAMAADVEDRLGRDLTDGETARLDALLEDAAATVFGYLGDCWTADSDVPSPIIGVIAKVVTRSLERGGGTEAFVTNQSAGPFTVGYSAAATGGDVWLTASDKLALRPYRCGGGLVSVQLVGERYDIDDESA